MKCEPWMNRDERTPEQKHRDQIRSTEHEEAGLLRRLEAVRGRLKELRGELLTSGEPRNG